MLPGYWKAEIKKVLAEMILRALAGKGRLDFRPRSWFGNHLQGTPGMIQKNKQYLCRFPQASMMG